MMETRQKQLLFNDFTTFENVYFLGIGGIGMSALARYFHATGKRVAGYDKTTTALTVSLENEGIEIHYNDLERTIPASYLDKQTTLVIRTPAVPSSLGELQYFEQNGFQIVKRAEMLGSISKHTKALCVAGTHGKTTTSALLTHILQQTEGKCTAFIGGIMSNYQTNVLIAPESEYTVIEADEFDRSFLHLSPYIAVITSTDPDHLDIYSDRSTFESGFQEFTQKISKNGRLVVKEGLVFDAPCTSVSYAIKSEQADYYATNLSIYNGAYLFDVITPRRNYKNVRLGIGGQHNIENALACVAICEYLNVSPELIVQGLETFIGVKRRFEVHIKTDRLIYIDDYAHHPTEIRNLIASVRDLYPNRKITGVFQPHLFSRTRDFFYNFAHELSQLDELILMPIYPAREKPIEGISSERLLEKIKLENKQIRNHHEVIEYLSDKEEGVFLTIGAGDIDRVVEPLKKKWREKE